MFLNLKFSPRRLPQRPAYICPAALNSCSQATLDDDAMLSRLIGLSRGKEICCPVNPGLVLIHLPCVASEAKRKKGRRGGCDIPRPGRISQPRVHDSTTQLVLRSQAGQTVKLPTALPNRAWTDVVFMPTWLSSIRRVLVVSVMTTIH